MEHTSIISIPHDAPQAFRLYPLRLHISTGVILDIIIENPIGIPGSSQHQNSLGINLGSTRSISRYPFLDPRTNNESAFQDLLLDLDTTSGIGLTLKKAINGDTQSQTDMGEIYSAFHLNYIRAKEWFLKAANQGHPIAQHSIGTFYLKGDGVPRSYKTANEWFLKAAEKEYPPSLTAIGILHHEGRVYSRDSNKAMEWFLRAEQHECASAPRNIAIMYNYGHGVAQDYSKALEWYSKAAERGNTFAQGEIGCLHRIGKGVPKSRSHTIKWYLLSAHQGNQRAQVLLGNLYYPRDPGLLKWHKIAAKQGVLSMQCSVAYSYYDGECVPLDYPLAATWFQLAVSRGDIQARNVLAEIYESGRGVPENLWMAKELYVKASRQLGSRDKLLQKKKILPFILELPSTFCSTKTMESASIISIPYDSPQGFRRAYRNHNSELDTNEDIIYITPRFDPEYDLYVVVICEDIIKDFEDDIMFWRGGSSVQL
ncbi:hypothetical protein BGZ76_000434 [Entomortierella beljakovae]|nr:hypothetical protein BGZ76_000434 [Entomortierella beljakovae]